MYYNKEELYGLDVTNINWLWNWSFDNVYFCFCVSFGWFAFVFFCLLFRLLFLSFILIRLTMKSVRQLQYIRWFRTLISRPKSTTFSDAYYTYYTYYTWYSLSASSGVCTVYSKLDYNIYMDCCRLFCFQFKTLIDQSSIMCVFPFDFSYFSCLWFARTAKQIWMAICAHSHIVCILLLSPKCNDGCGSHCCWCYYGFVAGENFILLFSSLFLAFAGSFTSIASKN